MTSWKNNNTLESRRLVEEVLDHPTKPRKMAKFKNYKWHTYAKEKPTKPGEYMVTIEQGHSTIWTVALYKSGKFVNWKDETDIKGVVTAWAEEV